MLLHLRFAWGVPGDKELPPIWDTAAYLGKGKTEGLATLNQMIIMRAPVLLMGLLGESTLQRPPYPPSLH